MERSERFYPTTSSKFHSFSELCWSAKTFSRNIEHGQTPPQLNQTFMWHVLSVSPSERIKKPLTWQINNFPVLFCSWAIEYSVMLDNKIERFSSSIIFFSPAHRSFHDLISCVSAELVGEAQKVKSLICFDNINMKHEEINSVFGTLIDEHQFAS